MRLHDVKNSKHSSGRTQYLKFLEGARTHPVGAINAKCFECCNGYVDGMQDCLVIDCSLYPFMPYRNK